MNMDSLMHFRVNSPKVIHETIDGEVVMIDFDSGNYYSLDSVGADIWSFIEGGAAVGEIVEAIAHRHKGSRAPIESTVNQLIAELQQEDLIVPDQTGAPGSVQRLEAQGEPGLEAEKPGFEAPVLHRYTDMQDLLLLDPIHETDEAGWPSVKPDSYDEDE